jgi:hypothetical protein
MSANYIIPLTGGVGFVCGLLISKLELDEEDEELLLDDDELDDEELLLELLELLLDDDDELDEELLLELLELLELLLDQTSGTSFGAMAATVRTVILAAALNELKLFSLLKTCDTDTSFSALDFADVVARAEGWLKLEHF